MGSRSDEVEQHPPADRPSRERTSARPSGALAYKADVKNRGKEAIEDKKEARDGEGRRSQARRSPASAAATATTAVRASARRSRTSCPTAERDQGQAPRRRGAEGKVPDSVTDAKNRVARRALQGGRQGEGAGRRAETAKDNPVADRGRRCRRGSGRRPRDPGDRDRAGEARAARAGGAPAGRDEGPEHRRRRSRASAQDAVAAASPGPSRSRASSRAARSASSPRRPPTREPELLAHDARDLGAVGAPLRLAHDVADDRADRLHVAGLDLLGGVGVGGERGLDDRVQRVVAAGHRAEALGLDDRGRVAAVGDEPVEHELGVADRHGLRRDERDELGQRVGRAPSRRWGPPRRRARRARCRPSWPAAAPRRIRSAARTASAASK